MASATLLGSGRNGTSGSGDVTNDLSGLGLAEDDVVILWGGFDGAAHPASIPGPVTSGYNPIATHFDTTSGRPCFGVWSKRMGATPDTDVVGTGSGSGITGSNYGYYAFRDLDMGTLLDAAYAEVSGTGGPQNPGSVTTVTDLVQVLVAVGSTLSNNVPTVAPSGYSDLEARGSGGTWPSAIAAAVKEVSPAGAEDPGTFTWTDVNQAQVVFTIPLRAAGNAVGPLAPFLSESHGDDWAHLVTTAFVPHPDDPTDTHQETDWQITTDADTTFSSPVVNVSSAVFLTDYLADATLTASTAYRARARHVGENFDGDWSNVVTFTTEATLPKPDTPTLSFVDDGEDYIEVSISAFSFPSEASAFHASSRVQIRLAADANWNTPLETQEAAFTGDASSRVFRFTGLTQNVAYKLRGRELDGYTGAVSDYSADLSETTDATPANAPLQPTLTIVTCGRNISVTGSAFAHGGAGTHASSEWRICVGSSCRSILSASALLAFTWEDVAPGTVTLSVRYRDNSGFYGPYSAVGGGQTCIVPDYPPNAVLTAPTDRVVHANKTITWEFFDPNEVGWLSYIQYSSDGASFSTIASDQLSPSTPFNITGKLNGAYTYRVAAVNPDTDEVGEWAYIVIVLDRTRLHATHYHFADFEPETLPGEQVWSDDTHISWALRDEFDPVENSTFRLGLLAKNVHSGSTVRRSGWVFPELGQPDEFDAWSTGEHIPGECEWFPYRFANAFSTRGPGIIFSAVDSDDPAGQSGNATMLDVGVRPWYLGPGMSCASDFQQREGLTVSAQYAQQHSGTAYHYARSFDQGRLRTVTDRANTGTLAQASTTLASSTTRTGGPYVYTDEENILGRGRQLVTVFQQVRRGFSGGNPGRFVKTRFMGAGVAYAEWHREEFVRDIDSGGKVLPCGSVGLYFEDLDQGGVGRSEGILFTDFMLEVVSFGECEAPNDETGCQADWRLTTFQPDDITPQYGTYTGDFLTGHVVEADYYDNRTCPRPFLMAVKDFSETQIDYPAGASDIGAIRVGVLDKRLTPADQDTGLVTAIINDTIGRRAVLERWRDDLGYVTVFDGVVESVQLDENMVVWWFNLRDPRERERNVPLFERNETFAIYPDDGPIEFYGQLPNDLGYLIPAAQPQSAAEFARLTPPEGDEGIHYGVVILSERTDEYKQQSVYPQGFSVYNASSGYYEFRNITVRWRLSTGGDWTYLRNMPSGLFAAGGQLVANAVIPPGEEGGGDWRLFMSSTDTDDLPTDEALIDLQILAANTTEATPLFWDAGSYGDLALAILRGDLSENPPSIRYSPEAFEEWALRTGTARFIARKPVDNMREWIQEHVYAPNGNAPSFDADMRIIPSEWERPASDVDLVELTPDEIIPVGGYSIETSSIVNKVTFTYIKESLLPAEDTEAFQAFLDSMPRRLRDRVAVNVSPSDLSPWERLVEEKVTREYVFPASAELVGTREIKYEPLTVRSTGLLGETLLALLGVDTADRLADKIGNNVISRFGWGAAEYYASVRSGMAHGPTFDPLTLDLVVGQWLKVYVPWLPELSTGTRGHWRYMQIVSITDPEIHYRRLRLQDGGPILLGGEGESEEGEEDFLPLPGIGGLTETAEQRVSIPITFPGAAPAGYTVRVDYAVSATEPDPTSGLWQVVSYLTSAGTVLTPIISAGETVWVRARGEVTGRRPSAWTASTSLALGDTPGLLDYRLTLLDDGLIQAAWVPNDFAGGLRFEISTGTFGHVASFGVFDDVDSDTPLTLNFTGDELAVGEEAYVRVTAFPGFSVGSVTGSPGSVYTLKIQRTSARAGFTHGLNDHTDTDFGDAGDRNDGDQVTWDGTLQTFVLAGPGAASGGYDEGTSFPGSPSTNDKFYHTTRNLLYFYDGTRWLSATLYKIDFAAGSASSSYTADQPSACHVLNPWYGVYDLWIEDCFFASFLSATATWVLQVGWRDLANTITSLAQRSTSGDSASVFVYGTVTVDAVLDSDAFLFDFGVDEQTGTATITPAGGMTFRIIG